MKHRKLYAATLALGLLASTISGLANPHSLPYAIVGMVGLLVLMKLPTAASHWSPLTRRLSPKLALLVISILISTLIAETMLQIIWVKAFPPLSRGYRHVADPILGWVPVPNERVPVDNAPPVANNSLGFRGAEFQRNGKASIMFLGDSFVWGYGISTLEDRFTDRIQAKHPEWNIENMGVIGYGTDQELLLLQRTFDTLKPRIVFLLFCAENDHQDNSTNVREGAFKPYFTTNAAGVQLQGVPVRCSETAFCATHPLLSRSVLYRLIVRVWKNLTLPLVIINDDPTSALILEMRKYVQAKGAEFVIGLTAPDPEVEHLLQQSGISWLDLNTDYRLPADPNGHWTPQGHSFAAARIEQFLLTNNALSRALQQQNANAVVRP